MEPKLSLSISNLDCYGVDKHLSIIINRLIDLLLKKILFERKKEKFLNLQPTYFSEMSKVKVNGQKGAH
jgi:hypothetical protein